MTILQVASGTSGYGGERIVLSLSNYLRDRGHKVIILSPGEGELVSICRRGGYKVVVIPLKKTYDIIAILRMSLLIKKENIDIVHSHGLLVNIISRIASFISGCKAVNSIHVIQHLRDISCPLSRKMRNIYYRVLDNFTSRFCQKIIAVSKAVEYDLRKQGLEKRKLLTIPNGIENIDGPVKKDRYILRQFGIEKDNKVIGLVGRVVPLKGHDDFVTCAGLLIPYHPHIKFLIIGDDLTHGGRYIRYLKERVKREGLERHVIFTGFIKSIREVMAGLDILTLPAWEEPFGLVILEAMSVRVPVIATDSGGVPEVIRDGENGLLVPPHSPEALSKAILRILDDRGLAARLVQGGVEAVKKYTARKMAEAVENIYINI